MNERYPILGLLQNPWATDAKASQEFMDRGHEQRRRWIMRAMPRSRTGRRLRVSLGDALFHRMIWDNADPTVSETPTYKAMPNGIHVAQLLKHYEPRLVVCYGKVASTAMQFVEYHCEIIHTDHPAYRNPKTIYHLEDAAKSVRDHLRYHGEEVPPEGLWVEGKG